MQPVVPNYSKRRQWGFTLIELMIVVGIIGILVSIAGPQFRKYSNQARQSEAKLALSAIYSLEKSFYSEYSSYIPAFDAIGYAPQGAQRFYYQNICLPAGNGGSNWAGSVSGYSGSSAVPYYSVLNNPNAGTFIFTTTCGGRSIPFCGTYSSDPQTFVASCYGQLHPGGTMDLWIIDDIKVLQNCSNGT